MHDASLMMLFYSLLNLVGPVLLFKLKTFFFHIKKERGKKIILIFFVSRIFFVLFGVSVFKKKNDRQRMSRRQEIHVWSVEIKSGRECLYRCVWYRYGWYAILRIFSYVWQLCFNNHKWFINLLVSVRLISFHRHSYDIRHD